MKKHLALPIVTALALGLTACGSANEAAPAETSAQAAETTVAAEQQLSSTDIAYHSVDEIKKRGELHMATEATFAPYAFKDNEGNIVGLEASMAKAIADDLGVTLVIDDMAFDSVLPSVQSGLDDVAIAALTPTAERKEAFTFTNFYFANGQRALIRAADADKFKDESAMVAGVTVGALKGSYQQSVAENLYSECTGRFMETTPSVVMDLKAGNIDVAVMDYDNAYAFALQNDDLATAFEIPMLEGDEASNCAAVMKGNDDLAEYLNAEIKKYIEDGSMQKWYEDAVALQQELAQ